MKPAIRTAIDELITQTGDPEGLAVLGEADGVVLEDLNARLPEGFGET